MDVNISINGSANLSIFGADNIPIGGTPTGVNALDSQTGFSGNYNQSFTNQSPAAPGTSALDALTNPDNNTGYGATFSPFGNSDATGEININLTIDYYVPFFIISDFY